MSAFCSHPKLKSGLEHVENTFACAGVTYAAKASIDFVSANLHGHRYIQAGNLSHYALFGGAFYLARLVSKYVFDKCFKGHADENFTHAFAQTVVAERLTTLSLIPLKVAATFEMALLSIPGVHFGVELANRARAALISAKA